MHVLYIDIDAFQLEIQRQDVCWRRHVKKYGASLACLRVDWALLSHCTRSSGADVQGAALNK